jgi:aminomethyltransferase
MLLPTLYDDPITEYWALVNDVTMWDVSVERCVEITGRMRSRSPTAHVSGPDDVRGRPVQVRADHGAPGWDRQRPGVASLEEDRFWLALADSDALLYAKGVAAFAGWR